jgi:hypothetical protein
MITLLQINNSGSWKTLLPFNAEDEHRAAAIYTQADKLFQLGNGGASLRTVEQGTQRVLMCWTPGKGWYLP